MSILIDKNTRVIVQGMTGRHGSFHTRLMCEYGTRVVAGVTPGKGGRPFFTDENADENSQAIPVYDTVKEALKDHPADYSVIFVPALFALAAAAEALEAGLNIVMITESVPVHDSIKIAHLATQKNLKFIGPNCPGIITPGECKIGIMPGEIFSPGRTGIVSRSGTLTYEIVQQMTRNNIGQSTVVGVGGDMINGLNPVECVKLFNEDNNTDSIVLIGEIGGDAEEKVAEYLIDSGCKKPVVAYIAGRTAPKEKKMGHAGAIIYGKSGTYENKIAALKKAKVKIANFPGEVGDFLSRL